MPLKRLCLAAVLAICAVHARAAAEATCLKPEALRPDMSPAVLFPSLVPCLREGDLPSAVFLAMAGNAYAYYDIRRVSDKTALSAGQALMRSAANELSDDQKRQLFANVLAIARDPSQLQTLCGQLRRIGPPAYAPTYMTRHGLIAVGAALTGKPEDDGLVAGFDGPAAWQAVLQGPMHCPAP